ncbi:MAG TPA: hypothetical protein VFH72_10495 [Candidatus Baltobacteraceae bacterium]|jgi:hypothetical protein|nr:hypothetical protein [Candidatus Baltobacteraceae bacterium]
MARGHRQNEVEIFEQQNVRCPFSATIDLIEHLHARHTEHSVGPFAALRTPVICNISEVRDYTDQTRAHEALSVHWTAKAALPVPQMDALLTVRPNGPVTQLRMHGRYEPPLGLFGRIFDLLVGRFLARRTVRRFLNELRVFIESEWQKERRAYGAS